MATPKNVFYNAYKRPPTLPESEDYGESVTEVSHVPLKIQINAMIDAGLRLQEYRAGMFDIEKGMEEDFTMYDPTRDPNFDMADASMLAGSLEERYIAGKKALKDIPVEEVPQPGDMPDATPEVETE